MSRVLQTVPSGEGMVVVWLLSVVVVLLVLVMLLLVCSVVVEVLVFSVAELVLVV